jgi:outer membrane biosynthesis protein TonB
MAAAAPSANRPELAGFAIALAAHAALLWYLSQGREEMPDPPETAMEVSFVEELGTVSMAPKASEAPAPALGEELAPVEEASGETASVPDPVTPPIPEPVRPPVQSSERRRPDLTRNPVQIRPTLPPRVSQQPRPQQQPRAQAQRPQPQQPQQPQAGGAPQRQRLDLAALGRSLGSGTPQGRQGAPGGAGTSQQAPAALTGAQQQAQSRQISGLIQPCAARAQPPNPFARTISIDLRVTVTEQGVPTGHQLLSSGGTNDSNSDYVDDVVGVAMRAVRACASRIATLPEDHYAIPGGWRTFRYRFRFREADRMTSTRLALSGWPDTPPRFPMTLRTAVMKRFLTFAAAVALGAFASPLAAQQQPANTPPDEEFVADVTGAEDSVFSVAVPVFVTPQVAETAAGNTQALGQRIAEVIVADLRNSRRFQPTGPGGLAPPAFAQVQAPAYGYWQGRGADNLLQGYVQANENGTLTVGCYLYDVASQSQIARQGFRRAARRLAPRRAPLCGHRCTAHVRRRRLLRHARRLCGGERAARGGGASSWR